MWGAETSLLVTAQHLARQGVQTGLLAQAPTFVEQWPGDGKRLARGLGFYARLLDTALRERPDALVCCSLRLAAPFAALRLLPAGLRPALVFDLHDYLPTERGRARIRLSTWWFDRVIAVSRFSAGQLDPDHTAHLVLARPVDAGDTGDTGDAADTGDAGSYQAAGRRVGVVGRLDADKRIELAVEAVRRLPDVTLVLRGSAGLDPAYTERLQARARDALGDRVVFEGRVRRADVMAGLACMVVANEEEALGRTVAEAQLAGVPVVVPDRGGAAELVEDGRTGRHYEAASVESLAGAIRAVVDDPEGTREMARRARSAAAGRHDPARVAREYLRFATSGPIAAPVRTVAARFRRAYRRVR